MEKNRKETLSQVRWYERNHIVNIEQTERPSFHLSSPIGWINDPNGFSVYNNEYHLFYQYHPYKTNWGPMYWGHSKSDDFIKWNYLPAALAPDRIYDSAGCFSGSALEDGEQHVLVYTGVIEEYLGDGSEYKRQVQNIAFGDGENYEKWEFNPVITGDSLPEGHSAEDFRDPKIWKENDIYYMVIGNCTKDGDGHVVLYKSKNLKEWEYQRVLDKSYGNYGVMWECPDYFKLGDTPIVIVSPQDMRAQGLEFHNGNGTVYITGKNGQGIDEFEREYIGTIDYGLDFYAPQTLETKDGRRVMIAWMQSWDSHITPKQFKWVGMMTLPRELTVKDGRLIQNPVRELEQYRRNAVTYNQVSMQGLVELENVKGREIDLTVEITEGDYKKFQINFAHNRDYTTYCSYDPVKSIVCFNRNHSGICRDVVCTREIYARPQDGKIKLRILLDKYSAEIFVNDGEQALTSTFYTPLEADEILFDADGSVTVNIEKYDIIV